MKYTYTFLKRALYVLENTEKEESHYLLFTRDEDLSSRNELVESLWRSFFFFLLLVLRHWSESYSTFSFIFLNYYFQFDKSLVKQCGRKTRFFWDLSFIFFFFCSLSKALYHADFRATWLLWLVLLDYNLNSIVWSFLIKFFSIENLIENEVSFRFQFSNTQFTSIIWRINLHNPLINFFIDLNVYDRKKNLHWKPN